MKQKAGTRGAGDVKSTRTSPSSKVTFSSLLRKGRPEAEGAWSMEMAWATLFGVSVEQLEGKG